MRQKDGCPPKEGFSLWLADRAFVATATGERQTVFTPRQDNLPIEARKGRPLRKPGKWFPNDDE